MESPAKKNIELPFEVDIHEERHKERYEQCYKDSLDSNICLPYDILRIVFQYLSGRDLSNVAMICRLWLEAANKEKCLRGPYCFMKFPYIHHLGNRRIKNILKSCFDCIEQSKLNIKPSIGFFFLPSSGPEEFYNIVRDCICELFPKKCKIIILLADTVNLNNCHSKYQNPTYNLIICALLPQISNVKISMVEVTDTFCKRNEYREYVQMIKGVRQDHKTSTCLMLFCNRNGYSMGLQMYSLAQKRLWNHDKNTIFFCGTVVNGILTNNENFININTKPYCAALLITGSIRTWSILMDRQCKTPEQVQEQLELFKKQVKLQKHSVGFVFGCNLHSADYMSNAMKTMLLKKLFPNVPLIGCLGICKLKRFCYLKDPVYKPDLTHNFSIMFMILTYN